MKLKNKKIADEWFDRDESDWLFAKAGEAETGQHHITCFLCHQAVEKILKGIIAGNGATPAKTHSLRILLQEAKPYLKGTNDLSIAQEFLQLIAKQTDPISDFRGKSQKVSTEDLLKERHADRLKKH